MKTDVLTAIPETLDGLDGWEVELVLDVGAEGLAPLATTATEPLGAAHFASAPAAGAPSPQNLVQMAVFPTVQETPATCVRILATTLIGLGSLLFASALFGAR
jgi:hypothetical protein